MMTTCRLLCALLVLALCCCPLVCAADSEKVQVSDVTLAPTGLSSSSTEEGQVKGQSGPPAPPVTEAAEKPGENAGAGQSLTGTPGLQIDTNKSAGETDQDAEASAQTTTTTTTRAPTTTTTTTTTTTAPEAQRTTSTETPTTTTHAPSRLREIDGSLSSSAWVCAPLLLAVCALAYTAVG
ncbi:mucin TcMUCII, putative [Trypanosoma cruzi]|uniref:Mucin TcMUCII, putative n=1 Tax=Trypanosoma cruzi (strain CL Brener) TaxID=353153 RepID=Q4DXN3_TRYCC|nr:mucin TcMUCII, putative [Trypanosoma cruzi]EAN97278.1 mucin TcMUCII, putative [Trypanosoma cruzi]|eukprot:XP_819129.1 mucin TcMUCII [Trypanosoma cruzi strain CL Brener]